MPARLAVIAVGEGQIAEWLCLRSHAVFREIKPYSVGRKEGEPGPLRAVLCACLTVYVCSYLSAAGVRWRRARLGPARGGAPGRGPAAAAPGPAALPGGRGGAVPPSRRSAGSAGDSAAPGRMGCFPPQPRPCAEWAGGPPRRARRSEAATARVRRRVLLAAGAAGRWRG